MAIPRLLAEVVRIYAEYNEAIRRNSYFVKDEQTHCGCFWIPRLRLVGLGGHREFLREPFATS